MTPDQRSERFRRIYDIGCICCARWQWYVPCDVHHLNMGQHAGAPRLGDEYTIGLCVFHHRGIPLNGLNERECRMMVGPSMKHEPVLFRKTFGSDEQLLSLQNYLIERHGTLKVGRRIA